MMPTPRTGAVLLLLCTACAAPSEPESPGHDGTSAGEDAPEERPPAPEPTFVCPRGAAAAFASFEVRFKQKLMDEGVPGGAAAMLCGGELAGVVTHGVAHAEGPAITPDTRFQWASTSKMFTGALGAALAEDGVVDLHEHVGTIVPALTHPGMTLHHLLTHTAGYPTLFPSYSPDLETAVTLNGSAPMWEAPGVLHVYSNPGTSVAGFLLAEAAGSSYGALVEQRLFAPAGMEATYDVNVVLAGEFAMGHRPDGSTVHPAGSYLHTTTYGPMGGTWGSVMDLARWGQVHLDPEPVMSAAAMELHRTGKTMTDEPSTEYGYAMFDHHTTPRVVSHSGGTDGYVADWKLLPDEGFGIFVVLNASWGDPVTPGNELIEELYSPAPETSPVAGNHADFVGAYHDPFELGTIHVSETAGALIASFEQTGTDVELIRVHGDYFVASYEPTGGFIDVHFWRPENAGEATHWASRFGIAPRVTDP
ncbi:MAG: serine hydrolase domain-containing protein [Polyangiaceae bacterium]